MRQPESKPVDNRLGKAGRRAAVTQHPPHAGRPLDHIPAGEAERRLEKEVAGEDNARPSIANTARPGPGGRGEPRRIDLDALQRQKGGDLRLMVAVYLHDVPHGYRR